MLSVTTQRLIPRTAHCKIGFSKTRHKNLVKRDVHVMHDFNFIFVFKAKYKITGNCDDVLIP